MDQTKTTSKRMSQRDMFLPDWAHKTKQLLIERGSKPPSQPKALSKQAVVEQLAPEIHRLQANGYRLDDIVASMNWDGPHFTTSALRSYLKRADARAELKAGRARSSQKKALGSKPEAKALQRNRTERPTVLLPARAASTTTRKHGNDYSDDVA